MRLGLPGRYLPPRHRFGAEPVTRRKGGGMTAAARERRMRALFEANARPLRRYLIRLTGSRPENADDLLQETMLRAWRRLDGLPADAESLRRWLFVVARNVAIDDARARAARPVEVHAELGAWVQATGDEIDRALDRQVLRDALGRLPEQHRHALVSMYGHGVPVADIASRLGVPEGTVRSRSFYALRKVRARMGSAS